MLKITGQYGKLKNGRAVIVNKTERIEFYEKYLGWDSKEMKEKRRIPGKTYTIEYYATVFAGTQYYCEKGKTLAIDVETKLLKDMTISDIDCKRRTITFINSEGEDAYEIHTKDMVIRTSAEGATIPAYIDVCVADFCGAIVTIRKFDGKIEKVFEELRYEAGCHEYLDRLKARWNEDTQTLWKMVNGEMRVIKTNCVHNQYCFELEGNEDMCGGDSELDEYYTWES